MIGELGQHLSVLMGQWQSSLAWHSGGRESCKSLSPHRAHSFHSFSVENKGSPLLSLQGTELNDDRTPSNASVTTTFNILVIDINDNAPEFNSSEYSVAIPELAQVGFALPLFIQVQDKDEVSDPALLLGSAGEGSGGACDEGHGSVPTPAFAALPSVCCVPQAQLPRHYCSQDCTALESQKIGLAGRLIPACFRGLSSGTALPVWVSKGGIFLLGPQGRARDREEPQALCPTRAGCCCCQGEVGDAPQDEELGDSSSSLQTSREHCRLLAAVSVELPFVTH